MDKRRSRVNGKENECDHMDGKLRKSQFCFKQFSILINRCVLFLFSIQSEIYGFGLYQKMKTLPKITMNILNRFHSLSDQAKLSLPFYGCQKMYYLFPITYMLSHVNIN